MHSRIYQISRNPIDKYDYIEEDRYYDHWFTNSVADYVDDDTDRTDDIQWLKDCYMDSGLSFDTDDNGEYFIVEDKVKYFASKFKTFQAALKELSEITLDEFVSNKIDGQMYILQDAYDSKFGFYVDGEETYLETFDSFMRYANIGDKFYIGATIDYHC